MKFILMHRTQRSSRWACGSVATATFALVTLAACDGAPANVASGVGSPTVLQASEVHVIGTSESIAVVEDLTVLSDGTVWVLNSVEPFFVGFGPDGDVLQVHGSRGGGPEEFRAPAGFVSGDIDGEAWVFDPIRHALIRISKPGTWSEISLPTDSTPRGTLRGGMGFMNSRVRTARLGDEIILARSFALFIPGQIFSFWLSTWGAGTRRQLQLGELCRSERSWVIQRSTSSRPTDSRRSQSGSGSSRSARTRRFAFTIDFGTRSETLRVTGPSSTPPHSLPPISPK